MADDSKESIVIVPHDFYGFPIESCQIFLGTTYQNRKNIPNGYEIYRMAIAYTK
jgi:hypothetical protein